MRTRGGGIASNPVLIGAATVLVILVAVWVDPAGLITSLFGTEGSGSTDPNLEPIDGIGVTVSSGKGDGAGGTATYRLRLVAH